MMMWPDSSVLGNDKQMGVTSDGCGYARPSLRVNKTLEVHKLQGSSYTGFFICGQFKRITPCTERITWSMFSLCS